MNEPVHPVVAATGVATAYDTDAYGWAMEQAALLRERRFDAVDWDNVAEEIEGVAKQEANMAKSRLRVLMVHILKWDHQPERRGRSWALTIAEQRVRYDQVIEENPSLRPHLDDLRSKAFASARIRAAREAKLDLARLPIDPPSWETLLERPFDPPAP